MDPNVDEALTGLVQSPSLGAIKYQAKVLIAELRQVNDQDYPSQACRMRDVFLAVATYVLDELETLHKSVTSELGLDHERVRALAGIVRKLYSFLQHLKASSAEQSPPPIQHALSQLTELHFPKTNGEPLALVRPQYDYNLTFENMGWGLWEIAVPFVLDPDNRLGVERPEDLLAALWDRWLRTVSNDERKAINADLPVQLAILSFAGLDTQDTLVYPLLAHELGHFIDHSFSPSIHIQVLQRSGGVPEQGVVDILRANGQDTGDKARRQALSYATTQASSCLRELIADLLGARMLGLGFFCAQAEYLKTISSWPQTKILFHPDRPWVPWGYPGVKYRLQVTLDHLTGQSAQADLLGVLRSNEATHQEANVLNRYIKRWLERVRESYPSPNVTTPADQICVQLTQLAERTVDSILPALHESARQIIPDHTAAALTPRFFERIECLRQDLPPWLRGDSKQSIAEILSAAWGYQIVYGERAEESLRQMGLERQLREYHKKCRLALKAIELSTAVPSTSTDPQQSTTNGEGGISDDKTSEVGVLSASSIRRRMQLPLGHPSRLNVVPCNFDAVRGASLDLHLGNWFAAFRRTMLKAVDLTNPAERARLTSMSKQLTFVPHTKTFLIHPGDFILGATLEFVALPGDLMAFVEGRSSLGRLGLLVATATQIAPGFHGVIVLELVNTGTVPLSVSPSIPIAQLVLQTISQPVEGSDLYQGEHQCQIQP